jgi:phosphoribosylamine-glycine ligase
VHAFWGASTVQNGNVNPAGGRVLTIAARGDDLAAARLNAYDAVRAFSARTTSRADLTS